MIFMQNFQDYVRINRRKQSNHLSWGDIRKYPLHRCPEDLTLLCVDLDENDIVFSADDSSQFVRSDLTKDFDTLQIHQHWKQLPFDLRS